MVRVATLPPTERGMYVDGKFIKPENVRKPKPPPPPPPPVWHSPPCPCCGKSHR